MVSHTDEFGVNTPDESENPTNAVSAEDAIYLEMQRQVQGIRDTAVPVPPAAVMPPIVADLLTPEPAAVTAAQDALELAPVEAPATAETPYVDEAEAAAATVASAGVALQTRRQLRAAGKLGPAPVAPKAKTREPKAAKAKSAKPGKPVGAAKPALDAAKPAKTKPGKTSGSNSARRTGRIATLVAMAFIAGLAVATSVPANALLTQSQIAALANGETQDVPGDSQEVMASEDGATAGGRDKVTALQWGGVLGGGLYTSITYHNNPNGKIQYPIRETVPISDGFGIRHNPFGSGYQFHQGVDFNPGEGHPIQAIADGVVTFASNAAGSAYGALGYYVKIDHGVIDGVRVSSIYAHMLAGSIQVKVGQHVKVTDILGQVGCTGSCSGAHLHFGLELNGAISDPLPWLKAHVK